MSVGSPGNPIRTFCPVLGFTPISEQVENEALKSVRVLHIHEK